MESFTARRSAASNLPTFQLPPPDHLSGMHKYPSYTPTTSVPVPSVSTVLTPPANLPNDNSPLSSVNSGGSGSSAGVVPPYQPVGYWSNPNNQNSSYTYSSAPPMPAPYAQQQQGFMGGRPLYSPSMNFQNRNATSPASGEGLPNPAYDMSLPPFPTPMSASGGQQQNLPTLAPQAQQQQAHQQQQHQAVTTQPPSQMSHQGLMNPLPASQAPHQHAIHAPEYGGRPPPTPTYYSTPSSTPQQATFPAYTQQSPTQQSSPHTTGPPPNRISPITAPPGYRPNYSAFNLPAMNGPIMSNMHQPGSQMSIVGGMNMQYQAHPMGGPMYGHHPQQQQQNDRPFKCDQCPQSFNRNHDLKRHKRIHLAVKPFPCGHCDKSFSRKDALKVRNTLKRSVEYTKS